MLVWTRGPSFCFLGQSSKDSLSAAHWPCRGHPWGQRVQDPPTLPLRKRLVMCWCMLMVWATSSTLAPITSPRTLVELVLLIL